MDGQATWRGAPISLESFLASGGTLLARCARKGCGAETPLPAAVADRAARASLHRLEDAVRCTCGGRRGSLRPWRGPRPVAADTSARCYLFVV